MITYSAENVKMPKIRKRDTTAWIRSVAKTYGKTVGGKRTKQGGGHGKRFRLRRTDGN